MTNEEAREILKRVEIAKPIKFEDYADMREALDMAIQALEQQPCEDAEEYGMNEQMQFPETFEGFAKEYGFKDDKEVYTNGSDLIPIFRVKQWLEQDNKLRAIEIDTAYECGKHANRWIPVTERLPEEDGIYLATCDGEICGESEPFSGLTEFENGKWVDDEEDYQCVVAWMPLPQPYKAESEGEE